ncbi:hypothetical protein BJ912DRAFT_622881 [Pholiota molesta]|nr:hypothetical protein BJ912DRAFT_622881 [Pholiota molesta]
MRERHPCCLGIWHRGWLTQSRKATYRAQSTMTKGLSGGDEHDTNGSARCLNTRPSVHLPSRMTTTGPKSMRRLCVPSRRSSGGSAGARLVVARERRREQLGIRRFAHLHLATRTTTTGGRTYQGADGWDECDCFLGIRHRGLLTQLRKGTAHNWRRRNRLAGAVGGGQQYHGCRDEWQQATHYAFQVSAGARMAIRCGRPMVVRCVCLAGGQAHLVSQIPAVRRYSVLVRERVCDAVHSPAMNGGVLLGSALGIRFIT